MEMLYYLIYFFILIIFQMHVDADVLIDERMTPDAYFPYSKQVHYSKEEALSYKLFLPYKLLENAI